MATILGPRSIDMIGRYEVVAPVGPKDLYQIEIFSESSGPYELLVTYTLGGEAPTVKSDKLFDGSFRTDSNTVILGNISFTEITKLRVLVASSDPLSRLDVTVLQDGWQVEAPAIKE